MRAIVEQRRRVLTKEEVEADSARIISQIEKMSVFREAKVVLMYYYLIDIMIFLFLIN